MIKLTVITGGGNTLYPLYIPLHCYGLHVAIAENAAASPSIGGFFCVLQHLARLTVL